MKKTVLIIIAAIIVTSVVSALFFTKPFQELTEKLPFSEELYSKSSLTVNTRKGIANVLIDDEDFGETPLELTDLTPGSHTITLSRSLVEEDDFYDSQTLFVELEANTETIVDIEIGPRGAISGYVLYYNQAPTKESPSTISVNGDPKGGNLFIDNEFIASIPLYSYDISSGDHKIKVEHELYESVEFPIIARDGFNLNITTYQFPIPLNIENIEDGQ